MATQSSVRRQQGQARGRDRSRCRTTRHGRRWVVLPLSTEPRLDCNPLAYRLDPSAANGLDARSFVMAWLPTTVLAEQLQGPIGRLTAAQVAAIAALLIHALDLTCQEPWRDSG